MITTQSFTVTATKGDFATETVESTKTQDKVAVFPQGVQPKKAEVVVEASPDATTWSELFRGPIDERVGFGLPEASAFIRVRVASGGQAGTANLLVITGAEERRQSLYTL